MIYSNGSMQLICIEGEGNKKALFVEINTNELIRGIGVTWNELSVGYGTKLSWSSGDYMGPVKNWIKKDTK